MFCACVRFGRGGRGGARRGRLNAILSPSAAATLSSRFLGNVTGGEYVGAAVFTRLFLRLLVGRSMRWERFCTVRFSVGQMVVMDAPRPLSFFAVCGFVRGDGNVYLV